MFLPQVPHTYSADGCLRFGDSIMLGHMETSTVLACDPFVDNIPGKGGAQFLLIKSSIVFHFLTFRVFPLDAMLAFRVAASVNAGEPVAQNTYILTRPPKSLKNAIDDDDVNRLHLHLLTHTIIVFIFRRYNSLLFSRYN